MTEMYPTVPVIVDELPLASVVLTVTLLPTRRGRLHDREIRLEVGERRLEVVAGLQRRELRELGNRLGIVHRIERILIR